MKKIYLIAVFCMGIISAQAQELKWHTNVKEAIAIGNKENKPLLMFFTGSDWCPWCIRLQKEVFLTPEFTKWAQEKVILVEIDDPRRTPQAPELRKEYDEIRRAFQVPGYPSVWFITAAEKEGKVNIMGLGNTGYVPGGSSAWLEVANGILNQK